MRQRSSATLQVACIWSVTASRRPEPTHQPPPMRQRLSSTPRSPSLTAWCPPSNRTPNQPAPRTQLSKLRYFASRVPITEPLLAAVSPLIHPARHGSPSPAAARCPRLMAERLPGVAPPPSAQPRAPGCRPVRTRIPGLPCKKAARENPGGLGAGIRSYRFRGCLLEGGRTGWYRPPGCAGCAR